ncbi:MAG: hypothetical protein NTAFB05_23360 [Nitrobacter sp.]|uniref:DUF2059 domain-containing protein n=1 Tax=Nitrobacter sp. TaxID=29420 RepID=UPI00387DD8D9
MIITRTISATLASVAFVVALDLSTPLRAQSAETLAAADRLIAAQDLPKMMNEIATSVAYQIPNATEAQKRAFVMAMTSPDFMGRLRDETRNGMAKTFTADELNALADFYSKPIAKSAMAKMGPYMSRMMAFIQKEIPSMVQRVEQAK